MARPLSPELNAIMLDATTREPAWAINLYDVRSTTDTINDVVLNNLGLGTGLQLLTGPQDFTGEAIRVSLRFTRGDYVQGGVVPTAVTVTLADEDGLLDPLRILGLDPDSPEYAAELGRYLRKGNVVVVRVGDVRVPVNTWPRVFTGKITGQAGRARSRSDGAQSQMSFRALSREADFVRYERSSTPFSIGTTYLQAADIIAQEDMFLDVDETDLGGWGAQIISHEPVQFVDETPLSMLSKLMFPDGFLPRFNGDGVLTQSTSLITANSDRVYQDLKLFRKIDRPMSDLVQPNCVTVVGLDADLTKVIQPEQRLATTDITTGYFANGEEINVFWADDRTIVAEGVQARVLKSVNGGLSILGGGETFDFIPAPSPGGSPTGETIGVVVTVDTGFAPWLVVFLLTTYVILAAVPDEVAVVATIPIGRIGQAAALSSALFVMTKIGRGQYEFLGQPVEWVYKEIRKRACVNGLAGEDRNTIEIENHLITTDADATNAARDTLFLLQAEENPRDTEMILDLALETDDIIEIPTGQRYLVDSITYSLIREPSQNKAIMETFEVTPGVLA